MQDDHMNESSDELFGDETDFLPEDWDFISPIPAGFVERTTELVMADQREIRDEAARVDEVQLPRELLDGFAAPAPSVGFVERTAQRIERDRQAATGSWRELIAKFTAPAPSSDFVERTLAALEHGPRPVATRRARRRWAAVAIAAAVIVGAALVVTRGETLAPEVSPVPWGTKFARLQSRQPAEFRFDPVDGLAVLARSRRSE